jgi:hypothetical protein
MKSIKISDTNWKTIMEIKLDMAYKTIDAVLTKLLSTFNKTYAHNKKTAFDESQPRDKFNSSHAHNKKEVGK